MVHIFQRHQLLLKYCRVLTSDFLGVFHFGFWRKKKVQSWLGQLEWDVVRECRVVSRHSAALSFRWRNERPKAGPFDLFLGRWLDNDLHSQWHKCVTEDRPQRLTCNPAEQYLWLFSWFYRTCGNAGLKTAPFSVWLGGCCCRCENKFTQQSTNQPIRSVTSPAVVSTCVFMQMSCWMTSPIECSTPWTYTECILSIIHSGIPSVYVTGGNTFVRSWISFSFIGFFYF